VPNYKFGKQKEPITFHDFRNSVKKAQLSQDKEAFIWILYYCGVRKSEAHERVTEDITITEDLCIIDFHQRKKRGETVPPLKLKRSWAGVNLIIKQYETMKGRRAQKKAIYVYEEQPNGKTRIWKRDGKPRPIKERTAKIQLGHWLFPNIQNTEAWEIVKKVLGEKYYPHFLRLNRLTEIGSDEKANIVEMKSFSGIKDTKTLEGYLGVSQKQQDKALEYMDKQINAE
jgi:hypothetical protein